MPLFSKSSRVGGERKGAARRELLDLRKRVWHKSRFMVIMAARFTRLLVLLVLSSVNVRAERITGPVTPGRNAILVGKTAYAPASAPDQVKAAIWAVNSLRSKPYRWGGGHRSFTDSGYDCSGTVSFALHGARAVDAPMDSCALRNFGERGRGRWFTIYSRRGHAFAVIAGLRLDTSGFNGEEGPRWRPDAREPRGFEARHPAGL
jgi:hypothetical protein